MRIILSRKGFDSGYGGNASAILPDKRMISFPIPDKKASMSYSDLHVDSCTSIYGMINELIGNEIKLEGSGKVSIDTIGCHLDPDIDKSILERESSWVGLFGQANAAQSHLQNKGVDVGDIFLFFGWFKDIDIVNGRYKYKEKQGKHAIFGYMEVGDIKKINACDFEEWMMYHPHVSRGKYALDNDYIYIASKKLTLNNKYNGYGTFKFTGLNQLTKEGLTKSKWDLPNFFKETDISYHSDKSWKDDYFQSAAKGQEFVLEVTPKIQDWLLNIIETCS